MTTHSGYQKYMTILALDERELASRRAFYQIEDEDLARLASLRSRVESWTEQIVEDFYALLLAHPETREILRDPALVQRLKGFQRDYFLGLFSGRCDLAYVEDRLRVGAVHERIGLAPKFYMGAYRRYIQLVHDHLYQELPSQEAGPAFASFLKLVSFDKALAIDTYIAAHLENFSRQQARIAYEKSARDAAEDARHWLTTTIRSIGDGFLATDAEGKIVMMNPVAERLTGFSAGEAYGRPLGEIFFAVNEDTGERIDDPVEHVLREGASVGLANHTALVGRDGKRTPIADSGAPIRDAVGNLLGVVLVFRDATNEKQEVERMRFLANATTTMASSLDYEETLQRVASLSVPALADWCEVHVIDPASRSSKQIAFAHADETKLPLARALREKFPSRNDYVIGTGRTEIVAEVSDELLASWAGSPEHLSLLRALGVRSRIIVPLSAGADVFGAIGFAFAESDRRYSDADVPLFEELARRAAMVIENARLYDAAQRSRQAADEANRSKDLFLATVSHELRTPLSAILGWSRMLLRHPGDESRLTRALASIERSSVAMAKLIEDLLDFSRIVSGRMRIEPRPMDLGDVVATALESVRAAAEAKGIRLLSSIERGSRPYTGDPVRLQQIVWNLVSNAVKFTGQGGSVQVMSRPIGDFMEIVVSDTGVGIESSFLPLLFDPFRQAGVGVSRATSGGLGLGLAITKHLVELHGGTITASSPGQAGKGSTFVVRLPNYVRAEAAPTPPPAPAPHAAEPPPRLDGLGVLVVEDDEDTRELLRDALQQFGARVNAVTSVREAMAAFIAHPPDVLLSDIGMPEENGYDLMRRVRALPADKGGAVPAAALTAYTRPEDRKLAFEAGYTVHVAKPVDPAELARVVKRLAAAA